MEHQPPLIEVCFSPFLYPVYEREEQIVVVIDVLRATSAICTAFEYGVKSMIPVATLEEATEYKQKGYLVGAERNGLAIEGFDFGNSPFGYMTERIKGQTVVITTTNGTQALTVAKQAFRVVIGAFTNISSLCTWLARQNRNVLLLCSGWKNRFNLEDTLFAGAVADRLSTERSFRMGDGALATKYLYQNAYKNPYRFLHNSSHKERLAALGLKDDIKYCLSFDKTKHIPGLDHNELISLSAE